MNKLVFGDYEVNKKEFYKSKQDLKLKDVIVKYIFVSNKVKINDKTVKYYIGYINDDNVVPYYISFIITSHVWMG